MKSFLKADYSSLKQLGMSIEDITIFLETGLFGINFKTLRADLKTHYQC